MSPSNSGSDTEYQSLFREAYRGEFFGEGFFDTLAKKQPDPDRREKLETLKTVEARTAQSLKRLASTAGVTGGEDQERANGRALADGIEPEDWDSFTKGLVDVLPTFLEKFERLHNIAGTPVDPALTALVNHEKAIQRFAELEQAGDEKKSLKPLLDHLPQTRVTIHFDLPVLEPAESITLAPDAGEEGVVVLLQGDIDFAGTRATRDDVFDERASAAYIPPGASITVSATTRSELAYATTVDAQLPTGGEPVLVEPTDVVVHDRGQPGWQRAVHDVVAEKIPAHKLIVGETFNAEGQWSSFPPHKHDDLEELYYHRFDKPEGFGFQGAYGDGAQSSAVLLRHGTVVAIPRGYHPVCAAPGYRLYYLWVLSGTPRRLAMEEDPAHRWLHGAERA